MSRRDVGTFVYTTYRRVCVRARVCVPSKLLLP